MDKADTLFKRKKQKYRLSPDLSILLDRYLEIYRQQQERADGEYFKVSEVFGSVAFLYEKLRNAVDYKGEHLLRRNAIERIVKRQLWEKPAQSPDTHSKELVRELIWARYLANNSVLKDDIAKISGIIEKYKRLFDLLANYEVEGKRRFKDTREWFLGVASAEIEEVLDVNTNYTNALNSAVFSWFKRNFVWEDGGLNESEKDIQVYIAVQRSLGKFDVERVRYHLLKNYYPQWETTTPADMASVAEEIFSLKDEIDRQVDMPVQPRMYRFIQKQSPAFMILKEIILKDIEGAKRLLSNPKRLEKKVVGVCNRHYERIRRRVNRGITRSIIYIFSTKVLLALLIEIPFEVIIIERINYLALGLNTVFPPFLMFLVGLSIKKPDEKNTQRIAEKINSFVYAKKGSKKQKFSLKASSGNKFLYRVFFVIYTLLSFAVFTGITFILIQLNFNLISGIIFFMFLSLVLLFGYRVRYTASELEVTEEREGFFAHLFTNITLPFLRLGTWLSEGFARFNFFIVLMDFLIEAPFKRIIKIFEEWTGFIRERREEVVEVPA